MTKSQLQKELKEKVKEGIKPSDLKKLKRSKSADDIKEEIKYPYTTLISQQEELDKLKKETTAKSDTIKLLRQKIEDLETSNPPSQLLTDQLKEKQTQIENLRKHLETTNQELNSLKKNHANLLDTNLTLKHQSLKDWFQQYQQTQKLETELKENVEYASNELINQDKQISNLQQENNKLQKQNVSLKKDLDLAQKLAELRKVPYHSTDNYSYLKYAFYALITVCFISLLNTSWKVYQNHE